MAKGYRFGQLVTETATPPSSTITVLIGDAMDQDDLKCRGRVDGLREEADRIQAEPAAAELERQEWVIARRRVDEDVRGIARGSDSGADWRFGCLCVESSARG